MRQLARPCPKVADRHRGLHLNAQKDPPGWLGKPQGPAAKPGNEKPKGETIAYEEFIKRWQ